MVSTSQSRNVWLWYKPGTINCNSFRKPRPLHHLPVKIGGSLGLPTSSAMLLRPHFKRTSKKSEKKVDMAKDFKVPQHLNVLDSDTEAEANKKRRAQKALRSKWRERKKEAETEQKQSFQKNATAAKAACFQPRSEIQRSVL